MKITDKLLIRLGFKKEYGPSYYRLGHASIIFYNDKWTYCGFIEVATLAELLEAAYQFGRYVGASDMKYELLHAVDQRTVSMSEFQGYCQKSQTIDDIQTS